MESQITGVALKVGVCNEIIAIVPSGIQMADICCECVQGMIKQLQTIEKMMSFPAKII